MMIYDRTENDVKNAYELRKKITGGAALSDDEKELLERGTLTLHTLNRIENKVKELKAIINSIGYYGDECKLKDGEWDYSDDFKREDFLRIRACVNGLKDAFYVATGATDEIGTNYLTYETINRTEKTLFELEKEIGVVKSLFKRCGNARSGKR